MDLKNRILIRWVSRDDLDQIVLIEKRNTAEQNPVGGVWSKKDFRDVLRTKTHNGIVVLHDDVIVGFCIYALFSDKVHIFNMVVDKYVMRKGFGRRLIKKMKSKLNTGRRRIMDIDVRESNLTGHLFLKSQDFKAIGIIKDWYECPKQEDAYKFRYTLEG